jgi:hypothetical protein
MIRCPKCRAVQATDWTDATSRRPVKPGDMNICSRCGLVGQWIKAPKTGMLALQCRMGGEWLDVTVKRLQHVHLDFNREGEWLVVDFDKSALQLRALVDRAGRGRLQ